MSDKKFSINESLRFGWYTVKANFAFFIVLFLIVVLISAIPNSFQMLMNNQSKNAPVMQKAMIGFIAFFFFVVFQVVNIFLTIGVIKISLKFADRERPDFTELYLNYPLFFKYLAGYILYALIVLGGLLLLIVPGIIWAIKYQYTIFLIVDKGAGPIESLRRSAKITEGVKLDLLVFGIVLVFINILGALCLLVGLFATVPTSMVAGAYVYRTLQLQTEGNPIPNIIAEVGPPQF